MTIRSQSLVLVASASILVIGTLGTGSPGPTPPIGQLLLHPALWGGDFPVVLANLPSWRSAGETNVVVFRDRALGGTAHVSRQPAEGAVSKLRESLRARPAVPRPEFKQPLKKGRGQAARFRAEVVPLAEDGSFRAAWSMPNARFLADGLDVKRVREALGAPEKVTTRLIQGERDMRPTVLTLHSYSDGAIVFAESDLSHIPGSIDRVYLDVAAVAKAVFKE